MTLKRIPTKKLLSAGAILIFTAGMVSCTGHRQTCPAYGSKSRSYHKTHWASVSPASSKEVRS